MRIVKERIRLPKAVPVPPPEENYETPPAATKGKRAAGIVLSPAAAKKIRKKADSLMAP